MAPRVVILLILSLLNINIINCEEILMMSEDEVCQEEIIATRPVRIIADDADLFIGALVNVHEPGHTGFYGCGNITQSGVVTFEALNWIAATINQEHGLINGKKVIESFIPGVKIGVRVYDSCGHEELSKLHLMDMFPIMETGYKNCLNNLSELKVPGVIDTTGLTKDSKVIDVSRQHFIPILPLTIGSALPAEVMSKIFNQILSDLKWIKVAIVHAKDEHSLSVVKLLGRSVSHTSPSSADANSASPNPNICFQAIESLPDASKLLASSKREAVEVEFNKIYDKLTSKLDQDTPIIIIGSFDELSIKFFTNAMIKRSLKTLQYQWIYSSMPEPEVLKKFGENLNSQRIYSLAPFPGKFAKFEEHWSSLQAHAPGPILGSWFDEYVCHKRHLDAEKMSSKDSFNLNINLKDLNADGVHVDHCERSMSFDRSLAEDDGDILWRTYQVMPIIHSIFTFSHAIRNAWIDTCGGVRGLCTNLKLMSREHFISHYLEPLQVVNDGLNNVNNNNPNYADAMPSRNRNREANRTPPNESSASNIGKLNWKLALTSFNMIMNEIKFQQHILYDSLSNEAQILGKGFNIKASLCTSGSSASGSCNNCLKVRTSRIDGGIDDNMFNSESTDNFNINSISGSLNTVSGQSVPEGCLSQCSSCWNEFVNKNNKLDANLDANSVLASTSAKDVNKGSSSNNLPSLSMNFRATWGIISSVTSGIGVLCVIICFIYFLMVFPVTIGTTILGYTILFGILIIFGANFLYIFPPNLTVCWLRKIFMSLGYCSVLSGCLVKSMNTWRRMTYKAKRDSGGDFKISSPMSLFLICLTLIAVHLIVTIVWLLVLPPSPGYYNNSWKCYPPTSPSSNILISTFANAETLISLLYIVLLVCISTFFCILTWKSYDNNREPRYILYSIASVTLTWIIWIFCIFKMSKNNSKNISSNNLNNISSSYETSRDVTIIAANLSCASIIMILLYIRKLYWYSKLRRRDRLIKERLQASAFPANFYGALHRSNYGNGPFLWDQMSYASSVNGGAVSTAASSVRGSITSLNTTATAATTNGVNNGMLAASNGVKNISSKLSKNEKKKLKKLSNDSNVILSTQGGSTRRPFEEDAMSCGSASSSVQVQGTDLYPMEVYDGGSQFQPSSLYGNINGTNGAIYEEEI